MLDAGTSAPHTRPCGRKRHMTCTRANGRASGWQHPMPDTPIHERRPGEERPASWLTSTKPGTEHRPSPPQRHWHVQSTRARQTDAAHRTPRRASAPSLSLPARRGSASRGLGDGPQSCSAARMRLTSSRSCVDLCAIVAMVSLASVDWGPACRVEVSIHVRRRALGCRWDLES